MGHADNKLYYIRTYIHTYRPAEEPGPPLTKTWYQNTSIYMHLQDL